MKKVVSDADYVQDMDHQLREIPGLVQSAIQQVAEQFARFDATPDTIQMWLDCGAADPFAPPAPVRHSRGCCGFVTLVVQRKSNDKWVHRVRLTLVTPHERGTIQVSQPQLRAIKDIHDTFVDYVAA